MFRYDPISHFPFPVYVAVRDPKTGAIIIERYRPSDSQATRDLHQGRDSATEALSPRSVQQALDPKNPPPDLKWTNLPKP